MLCTPYSDIASYLKSKHDDKLDTPTSSPLESVCLGSGTPDASRFVCDSASLEPLITRAYPREAVPAPTKPNLRDLGEGMSESLDHGAGK